MSSWFSPSEGSEASSWFTSPEKHAPGLPEHFHFLDSTCRSTIEELPQFAAVRAVFGVDEEAFRNDSQELLFKLISEGSVSTAKSGSLMAFHGGLMAKSMAEEEVSTLMVIIDAYLKHIQCPENAPSRPSGRAPWPGTLLPRFFGAYVYSKEWSLTGGFFDSRTCIFITANVFSGVPKDIMGVMERLDIKGSADDRAQRKPGGELMCFDLLRRDQKFVPASAAQGEALLAQLERDTAFLLAQHMPRGPLGLIDYDQLPESYRGAPGLMDYSLLVGVVPRGTPGGCVCMDVSQQRLVREAGMKVVKEPGEEAPAVAGEAGEEKQQATAPEPDGGERWRVHAEDLTIILGIIDILQFWTPRKRIARRFKKLLGMERDDNNEYNGAMLDTVRPEYYRPRFLAFMRELFSEGSWADSLPRLYGRKGKGEGLVQRQVSQLPEPAQRDVRRKTAGGWAPGE